MSEPYDPARVPDVAHWLEGWRTWRVVGSELHSLGQRYVWPARRLARAECVQQARLCGILLGVVDGIDVVMTSAGVELPTARTAVVFSRSALKAALAEHGPAPGRLCTCGLYARSTPPPWEDLPGHGHGFVVGRVALWGKVIRGATGMRAEYAYPLSLSDRRLARRYGVPYDRALARRATPLPLLAGRWLLSGIVVMNAFLPLFALDWSPAAWWLSTVALTTVAYLEWRR